jgi:acid phosphatase
VSGLDLAVAALLAVTVTGCTSSAQPAGPASTPPVTSSVRAVTSSAPSATSSAPAPSATSARASPAPTGLTAPKWDHVVVVVEENHAYGQVLGAGDAPYLDQLARSGTSFTNFIAETHPSQPNYLAMFSGSTQGITDDSCPHTFAADNLGAQLRRSGRSFTGYSENLPSPGWLGCAAGSYGRKHSPWVDFANLPPSVNQTFTAWPGNYSQLPSVAFVVPDVQHDMHDGSVAEGDMWLRIHLDGYVAWARTHRSLLVVTWDEDDFGPANRVATIAVGDGVPARQDASRADHYSLLRTIEENFGLAPLGSAAAARPLL